MGTLSLFVVGYLLVSIAIGFYASLRVRNSTDFVLAGRSLPLYITIATVFATWFGSEAVLGIPATFVQDGLGSVLGDPFGAGMCLIFVGAFFAARLYRMKLMTIGDFYRQRYGRSVEVLVSAAVCISYLGWVSAQLVAMGLVITIISDGAISMFMGMLIGIGTVIIYTIVGGMWSVVITDFVQMMMIIVGLLVVAALVAGRFDGGAMEVINHAVEHGKFDFWPTMSSEAILAFIATFITMALGSIPQQDVFQRVMSSKDEKTAAWGSIIGGSFYILFCFVPMFITYAVVMLDPALMELHSGPDGDYQRILPEYILREVPIFVQILFFGALLSAIMSTASATLLALSATMSENILKEALHLKEKAFLITLRVCVFAFGMIVFAYGYASVSAGLSIFEMVENAYLVTLCGAFVPLAFGVYWKGATKSGALTSIFLGVGTWVTLEVLTYGLPNRETAFLMPPQLAGLLMAILGMLIGSKLPLMNKHHHAPTQSAA